MLEPLTHQSIIDALGNDGLLNDRVLELFRRSEIWRIDLSASFKHENGLNLAGTDTLKGIWARFLLEGCTLTCILSARKAEWLSMPHRT
jgi:hypothetical protein